MAEHATVGRILGATTTSLCRPTGPDAICISRASFHCTNMEHRCRFLEHQEFYSLVTPTRTRKPTRDFPALMCIPNLVASIIEDLFKFLKPSL